MKPVAIIRFSPTEGPGHLAEFLDAAAIPWRLIRIDAGDPLPAGSREYAGIAMMGGPMSVNDPLPWIASLLELIRDAVAQDIPLIGHCLGGQLMAKALGGTVVDNHCKEMGWHKVDAVDSEQARFWLGELDGFVTFQWHYQTFSIPPGAVRILRNPWCENQAFALGPHIGFQCHIEMTAEMVEQWCRADDTELAAAAGSPSVQACADILAQRVARVAALNQVADRIYRRWAAQLK